jgi:trk system potassium uptake protein TrkA
VHIVIMGCGRVGSTLARGLEHRNHTVSIIDQNPDAFRRLGPTFSGNAVTGVGFDRSVMLRAGVDRADAFAAVSSGDNSNIISARVAREQFDIKIVVARIYDPRRAEVYERLGVPTVATVTWAADQVLRRLLPTESEPVYRDPSGTVRADQLLAPERWVGHTVYELQDATKARIAFMTRLGRGMIPDRRTVIQEGDLLNLFLLETQFDDVHAAIRSGPEESQ